MLFGIRKNRFFTTLILLYFTLFAISTLSYANTHERSGEASPHLFLLELIGSKIIQHSGGKEAKTPFLFLFFKKRAILPTENLIKKTPAQDHVLVTDQIILPEESTFAGLSPDSKALPYAVLLSFHSGISPPER